MDYRCVARVHRCPGNVHRGRDCGRCSRRRRTHCGDRYFENRDRCRFTTDEWCWSTIAASTIVITLLLLWSSALGPRRRGFALLGSGAGRRRWQSSCNCLCVHLLLPFQRMRLGVLTQVIFPVEALPALAAYLKCEKKVIQRLRS